MHSTFYVVAFDDKSFRLSGRRKMRILIFLPALRFHENRVKRKEWRETRAGLEPTLTLNLTNTNTHTPYTRTRDEYQHNHRQRHHHHPDMIRLVVHIRYVSRRTRAVCYVCTPWWYIGGAGRLRLGLTWKLCALYLSEPHNVVGILYGDIWWKVWNFVSPALNFGKLFSVRGWETPHSYRYGYGYGYGRSTSARWIESFKYRSIA